MAARGCRLAVGALLLVTIAAAVARGSEDAAPRHPFFVMDNGVGRGKWTPDEQAQAVREIGYDGMSYNYTNQPDLVARWSHALGSRGLKLFGLYFHAYMDGPAAKRYPVGLRETIERLKGTDTVLWMTLRETKDKKKSGYDETGVAMVREVSDWARRSGLKVALYPHAGFYVATAEEALRIVKQVDRPDVGMTVNLCHELMAHNGDRLPEIIRQAGPHLFLVTINGADRGGKPSGYIQRLDQGSYDVGGFLKALDAAGYRGPVGLQCVGIKGDIRENLVKSLGAWKKYTGR
jgi:sugar phosphate isomerase/epimerase